MMIPLNITAFCFLCLYYSQTRDDFFKITIIVLLCVRIILHVCGQKKALDPRVMDVYKMVHCCWELNVGPPVFLTAEPSFWPPLTQL